MKTALHSKVKEYFWNGLKKITNTFSNLKVIDLGNSSVKCFWEISSLDNLRIEFSKSCFYAIRLFDITNNRDKNLATCIMKEIQVSKYQSSISFPIPVNKGVYYFELGYRKRNGEWRKLAFQTINFGFRIQKVIPFLYNDNWFDSNKLIDDLESREHENAYQLSLNTSSGGSENLIFEKKNI